MLHRGCGGEISWSWDKLSMFDQQNDELGEDTVEVQFKGTCSECAAEVIGIGWATVEYMSDS